MITSRLLYAFTVPLYISSRTRSSEHEREADRKVGRGGGGFTALGAASRCSLLRVGKVPLAKPYRTVRVCRLSICTDVKARARRLLLTGLSSKQRCPQSAPRLPSPPWPPSLPRYRLAWPAFDNDMTKGNHGRQRQGSTGLCLRARTALTSASFFSAAPAV